MSKGFTKHLRKNSLGFLTASLDHFVEASNHNGFLFLAQLDNLDLKNVVLDRVFLIFELVELVWLILLGHDLL